MLRNFLVQKRYFHDSNPPAPPRSVRQRNVIVAVSLLSFVGAVFWYTLSQMRKANPLGHEFDMTLEDERKRREEE